MRMRCCDRSIGLRALRALTKLDNFERAQFDGRSVRRTWRCAKDRLLPTVELPDAQG
jgi:hypothetical protein